MKKPVSTLFLLLAFFTAFSQSTKKTTRIAKKQKPAPAAPIPIKVVIVTTFENGKDTGDVPGEFQYWVERLPLNDSFSFPQGFQTLRYNKEKGILGICTGMGNIRSASSVMALGMDPRFDLSHSYWMVAGIAGVDPEDATLGSAAWAEWVVDGDLAYHIDNREIPQDWTTGYVPLGKAKPYEEPAVDDGYNNVFHLNAALVNWAYNLTKDVKLLDNEIMQKIRARYVDFPEAQKPPKVMLGDNMAAMTYWHGKNNNDWANAWVKYWSQGKGNFVTSAMEDAGVGQALEFLSNAGRADFNRLLVLRTASNFSMQHAKITAVQSLKNEENVENGHHYSGYIPSLEAAYKTGKVVVDNIVNNWQSYKDKTPGM